MSVSKDSEGVNTFEDSNYQLLRGDTNLANVETKLGLGFGVPQRLELLEICFFSNFERFDTLFLYFWNDA